MKISADNGGLLVTATDSDSQLDEEVYTEPCPDWSGCIDASRFAGFVNALPADAEITIRSSSLSDS